MIKLEIGLDEEKIKKEQEYDINDIYAYFDQLFASRGLTKMPNIGNSVFYKDSGKKTDMGDMFVCVLHLTEQQWFMKYANKCIYYNNNRSKSENDFEAEDILEIIKQKSDKDIQYAI